MIEVNNLTTININKKLLINVSRKVVRGEKIKGKIELSIALVGQAEIKKINKRYRSKGEATDVLAFSEPPNLLEKFPAFVKGYGKFSKTLRKGGKIGSRKEIQNLGEIVICPIEIRKNAKRFTPLDITRTEKKHKETKSLTGLSSTFEKELIKALIHGILHLLGYEHEKNKRKAEIMEEKQNYYFSRVLKL